MITCFKGKVDAYKAVRINLNSKSDFFINAFGIIDRVHSIGRKQRQSLRGAHPMGYYITNFVKDYEHIIVKVSRGWNNFRYYIEKVKTLYQRKWANLIT